MKKTNRNNGMSRDEFCFRLILNLYLFSTVECSASLAIMYGVRIFLNVSSFKFSNLRISALLDYAKSPKLLLSFWNSLNEAIKFESKQCKLHTIQMITVAPIRYFLNLKILTCEEKKNDRNIFILDFFHQLRTHKYVCCYFCFDLSAVLY